MSRIQEEEAESHVREIQRSGRYPLRDSLNPLEVVVFESFFMSTIDKNDDYYTNCRALLDYYKTGDLSDCEDDSERKIIVSLVALMVRLYVKSFFQYREVSMYRGRFVEDERDDVIVSKEVVLVCDKELDGGRNYDEVVISTHLEMLQKRTSEIVREREAPEVQVPINKVVKYFSPRSNFHKMEFCSQLRMIAGFSERAIDKYKVGNNFYVFAGVCLDKVSNYDFLNNILNHVARPYNFRCVSKQAYRYYLDWVKVQKEREFSLKSAYRDSFVHVDSEWSFPVGYLSPKSKIEGTVSGMICAHLRVFCIECSTVPWLRVLRFLQEDILSYYNSRMNRSLCVGVNPGMSFLESMAVLYDMLWKNRRDLLNTHYIEWIMKYLKLMSAVTMIGIEQISLDLIMCVWLGGYRDGWATNPCYREVLKRLDPRFRCSVRKLYRFQFQVPKIGK